MFTYIRHLLTERDNVTACPVRVGTVGTGVIYHAAAAWMVFRQHAALDMTMLGAYVQHMSILASAAAAGVGVKSALKGDATPQDQP